jgi:hypothetical protein
MSRVAYHQTIYDLLALKWGECPDAARRVARFEAAHGPLAASVKEWYSLSGMVELECPDDLDPSDGEGTLWHDSLPHDGGCRYQVRPLEWLLGTLGYQLRHRAPLPIAVEVLSTWGFYTGTWSVHFDGSDDPPRDVLKLAASGA